MPFIALEIDDKKGLIVEIKGKDVPPELLRAKSRKIFESQKEAEDFLRERGLKKVRQGSIAGVATAMCGNAPV